ncbi:MAG: CcdB family protein [Methylococcaceae bacterium]
MSSLETTVVVPICPLSILKKPVRHLNPMLTINGEMYCM